MDSHVHNQNFKIVDSNKFFIFRRLKGLLILTLITGVPFTAHKGEGYKFGQGNIFHFSPMWTKKKFVHGEFFCVDICVDFCTKRFLKIIYLEIEPLLKANRVPPKPLVSRGYTNPNP